MNWLYVGLAAFAVYGGIFGYCVAQRRWTKAGLGVGLTNLLMVMLNLAAPFRGALDPDYLGYNVGLIHVQQGLWVTAVSGSIVVATLASACIAVLDLRGRAMGFVAAVDSALVLLIGLPISWEGLADPSDYSIQLGEYLVIPGMIAVLISAAIITVPLVASVVWSAGRVRSRAET